MNEKIQKVIEKIRPSLQMDGGDVELVEVTGDGVVKVRLRGACAHCPMSVLTLKQGVEAAIKKEVPEIKKVVAV
ncbi:NifU family protein [Candidatus Falkowbacteria bacterium]|nr:NifU family protein [Candidatus Falkowbacteria bacterium]